jgi:hypothetical protein
MIEVTEEFGFNAGRVWKALDMNGSLTEIQLMEETSLRENEVFAAVGWLARENKIRRDGDVYRLDETNLTFEIGGNAGMIWDTLFTNGELDTTHISRLIQKDDRNIFSALGWLARESKIQLSKKKQLDAI